MWRGHALRQYPRPLGRRHWPATLVGYLYPGGLDHRDGQAIKLLSGFTPSSGGSYRALRPCRALLVVPTDDFGAVACPNTSLPF
jgi:hypothetical protein